MKGLNAIVLIEDNPYDAELALATFTELNLANDVIVLSDGVEALEYLYCRGAYQGREGGHPAVVLLDVKMPKMSGVEVLRVMKNDEDFRTIPVVMLTSSREERDLVECYRMGTNAYVVKPVDFQQFVQAMKHLGAFWALVNERPRRSHSLPAGHATERLS